MGPLDDAYFNATYAVRSNPPRSLTFATAPLSNRENPPPFARPWAIITAFNPGSTPLSDAENALRDHELLNAIRTLGRTHTRTESSDARGGWREPGWLIEAITRNDVLQLARRFGQRAVLFAPSSRAGLLITPTERWLVRPLLWS
ncbi:MAG: DUF3293 domain-containing protein [Phycisphaerales bacterium]